MIALLITIVLGLAFAYFATQNTQTTVINFMQNTISPVPVYIVILGSVLAGIILSTVIIIVHSISNFLLIRKKENTIRELKKTTAELIKRVHILELENEKEEGKETKEDDEVTEV